MAVNAFNRTQNLNYLYMSVFKPATSYRWLGNIKKYRVTPDGEIRDVEQQCGGRPEQRLLREWLAELLVGYGGRRRRRDWAARRVN